MRLARHSMTLAWRSLWHTRRTPEELIDVTLQPILFLTIFTFIFGGAIAHGSQHDYLQFVLPGLLGQSIALGSVALGVNLSRDLEKGVFDRFRSLPIARSVPLVGAVLADFARYLILCVIYLGFGYAMGFRIHTDALSLLAAVLLAIAFALCFCWVSLWVGLVARSPGSVQGVMFLLIFPLAFGSSTYVSPSTMPGWLQAWNHVNPITRLVDAMRGLLIGGPVQTNLLLTFAWMAALLAVFVPLALRAYKRRA